MRKGLLSISLMAAVIFAVSCNKEIVPEELPDQNLPEVTYIDLVVSASADMHYQDPQSKTQLGTDGISVLWKKGDELSVFDGTANNKFTTPITEPSASASFSGQIAANATDLYALYPYRKKATLTGTTISTFLSNEQNALVNDFANSAVPLVAKATIEPNADAANPQAVAFQFKNICNLLKIEIPAGLEVRSILIEGNNGELIAGEFDVDMSSGTPAIKVTKGETIVKLSANGGTMTEGVYYAAILPVNFTKGLTITFTSGDGATYKQQRVSGSNPLDVSVLNKIQPLSPLPPKAPEICNNYLKWNDGQDIDVGGVKVNKKTFVPVEDDKHRIRYITNTTNKEIRTGKDAVVFVDPDAENVVYKGNDQCHALVIGNDDNRRSKIYRLGTNAMLLGKGDFVAYKNIEYTQEKKGYVFTGHQQGGLEHLVLDNCGFVVTPEAPFITFSDPNMLVKQLTMVGCDIKFSQSKPNLTEILVQNKHAVTLGKYVFKNNVFYSDSPLTPFRIYHGDNSTIEFELVNNTIVNLYIDKYGYFNTKAATSAVMNNNLFYLPLYNDPAYISDKYFGILYCKGNLPKGSEGKELESYPPNGMIQSKGNYCYRIYTPENEKYKLKATWFDLEGYSNISNPAYDKDKNALPSPFGDLTTPLTPDQFKVIGAGYPSTVGATR